MAKQSAPLPLKLPSEQTLDKYGFGHGSAAHTDDPLEDWLSFVPVLNSVRVCSICWKPPKTGRYVVDHKHVAGYALRPPDERRAYVRGVVCTTDNHFLLTRYGNATKHARAAAYLLDFDERLVAWLSQQKAT